VQDARYLVAVTGIDADPRYPSSYRRVTLTSHYAPLNAGGNVRFMDGATVLGVVQPYGGVASLTCGPFESCQLSSGTHPIVAEFMGQFAWKSATSDTLVLEVDGPNTAVITPL